VGWSATPATAADLTRLRHSLPALVGHRSRPAGGDLDELLLVFEELASNGLRHGRPPVRVVVAALRTGWLIVVSDAAAECPPVPARDRDLATSGLGLCLVAVLSGAHGWTVDGDRKHIWARIDAGSSARRSPYRAIPAPPRVPV
jgi:histidine kinase-like protein